MPSSGAITADATDLVVTPDRLRQRGRFGWVELASHRESVGGRFDFAIEHVRDYLAAPHAVPILKVEAEYSTGSGCAQLQMVGGDGGAEQAQFAAHRSDGDLRARDRHRDGVRRQRGGILVAVPGAVAETAAAKCERDRKRENQSPRR